MKEIPVSTLIVFQPPVGFLLEALCARRDKGKSVELEQFHEQNLQVDPLPPFLQRVN
jgi:hypothetical protein